MVIGRTRTYEGLKRRDHRPGHGHRPGRTRTYEGLKLSRPTIKNIQREAPHTYLRGIETPKRLSMHYNASQAAHVPTRD